jgi:hypothetical protein
VGMSKTHPHSAQAVCLTFAMRRECGTPPNV